MAINYDDIITRANARKDTLQELQRLLRGWDQYAQNFEQAATYAEQMIGVLNQMDVEAREVLTGLKGAAAYDRISALHRACDIVAGAWRNRNMHQTWETAEELAAEAAK